MRLLDRIKKMLIAALLLAPAAARGQSVPRHDAMPSDYNDRAAVKFTVQLSDNEYRTAPEQARQDVLEKAQRFVVAWLREIRPDSRWEPSIHFLWERGILRNQKTETVKIDLGNIVDKKDVYTASVDVVINDYSQAYLLREVRCTEAVERQWGLARLFLATVVLLGALAGYYWFDELSKGYYTNWLRVGLAGVLIAAGFLITRLTHLRELLTPH